MTILIQSLAVPLAAAFLIGIAAARWMFRRPAGPGTDTGIDE